MKYNIMEYPWYMVMASFNANGVQFPIIVTQSL